LSAIDYLLKPVRPNQVKEAIDKAMAFLGNSQINKRLSELKDTLQTSDFKKIGLPNADGIKFVSFKEIISLEADSMYTKVSTVNDTTILVSKPLKFFVELLQKVNVFYRPHRSYLINLTYIKEYIKKDGGYILMENDKTISISKDKRDEFLMLVQNI
jgi:two-component system LytT family response regulator